MNCPSKLPHLAALGVLPVVFSLGGCATVIEGGDQVINVSSTGCQAHTDVECTAVNDKSSSVFSPPASISVDKEKDELEINCESKDGQAKGQLIVKSSYEAWNAGNILIGGIIGVGVDAATGAMWKYPAAVVVPMSCPEEDATEQDTPSPNTDAEADAEREEAR